MHVFTKPRPSEEHSIAQKHYSNNDAEKVIGNTIDFFLSPGQINGEGDTFELSFELWPQDYLKDDRSY